MSQLPYETSSLGLVGGTSFGRYHKISTEETFNMFISNGALVDFAGYVKRAVLNTDDQSREIFRSTRFNHLIVVVGNTVYSVNDDFSVSIAGTMTTSEGSVYITENLNQEISITDGVNIYVYNWGTHAFTTLTPAILGFTPIHLEGMDGYTIAAVKGANQWRLSDINNALSWPNLANNTGLFQTKADNVIATVRLDRQLFVMGRTATELWRDVGASTFPFQRDNSLSIDYGVVSADSIAAGFGMVVWLASNEKAGITIRYSSGSRSADLTENEDGINFVLDQLTSPESATGFLFEEDGHILYQITFPQDNLTYVYDFTTKKFFTLTDENLDFHIAKRVAFFDDKLFFLSFREGVLFEMGTEFTNYDGKIIPRIRKTRPFRLPTSGRFIIPQATITIEQGNAATEQRVLLSLSKDGGESFGNVQSKVLNPLGKRRNQLQYWALGAANDITFQFRFESLDRFVVIDGNFQYYQGAF